MNKTIRYIGNTLVLSLLVILFNSGKNTCLKFDGINDYVEIPHNSSLNFTDQITVEAWVYLISSTNDWARIADKDGWSFGSTGWFFGVRGDNGIQFGFRGPLNYIGTTTTKLAYLKWYHVAARFDKNTTNLEVFINGIKDATTATRTVNIVNESQQPLRIGNRGSLSTELFHGYIDDVRLWNRALTQTEIRQTMCQKLKGNESGLVGYWRMDEGSGNKAYDLSGNGNNGTLY